jgi:hypothetical protein
MVKRKYVRQNARQTESETDCSDGDGRGRERKRGKGGYWTRSACKGEGRVGDTQRRERLIRI